MFQFHRFLTIACTVFLITACQNNPTDQSTKNIAADTSVVTAARFTAGLSEQQVVDTLLALKEVQDRKNYINQHSMGQRHLAILVEQKPDATHPFYTVKVGEDTGEQVVTHFHFMVYPSPFRIMYYDVANDKELTLDEWRSQK